MRIPIPKYASENAKKGLKLRAKLPKSKKFGLSPKEANIFGVTSGINMAKKLIRNKSLSINEAKQIRNTLNRFKNAITEKQIGVLLLWGDDKKLRFLQYLNNNLKNYL